MLASLNNHIARRKKGFGTVQCSKCGDFIQSEPVYYQIIQRKQTDRRCRTLKVLMTLCEICFNGRN